MTQTLHVTTIETPLGKMQAVASNRGLCALEFVKPDREKLLAMRLTRWFPDVELQLGECAIFARVRQWLKVYFKGDFAKLPSIALEPRGTEFEMGAWKVMRTLKPGATLSYAALASKIGNPKASRAVGNASRRNPIALIVPCHRIIGANGSLTGYGGGLSQKEWLLKHEVTHAKTFAINSFNFKQ